LCYVVAVNVVVVVAVYSFYANALDIIKKIYVFVCLLISTLSETIVCLR